MRGEYRSWIVVALAVLLIVLAFMAITAYSCAKDAMREFRICFGEQCASKSLQSLMYSFYYILLSAIFVFLTFIIIIVMLYVMAKD